MIESDPQRKGMRVQKKMLARFASARNHIGIMNREIPPTGDEGKAPDPADESGRDAMAPPEEPCQCSCLHCERVFMSDQMWFQRVIGDPSGFKGYWMCPTPNCGGAGFAFDVFPIDPNHPANADWHYSDDDDEDEVGGDDADGSWDSTESKYQEMDEDEEDDDLEGEEWKLGLDPGERPEPEWMAEARRQEEARQKHFDEPDLRPRQVDWTPREHPGADFNSDDIPF